MPIVYVMHPKSLHAVQGLYNLEPTYFAMSYQDSFPFYLLAFADSISPLGRPSFFLSSCLSSVQPSIISSSSPPLVLALQTLRFSPSSKSCKDTWFSAPVTWLLLRAVLGFLLLSLPYVCSMRLNSFRAGTDSPSFTLIAVLSSGQMQLLHKCFLMTKTWMS